MEKLWLIWSNEHKAWWRENGHGYTYVRADAGRFTFEDALQIVADANYGLKTFPHEAMVRDN